MELSFLKKHQELDDVWSLYFSRPAALQFEPGDYVDVEVDIKNSTLGDRRWLTISSSPTKDYIRFTTRLTPGSEFKKALLSLEVGQKIQVSPPIGTFHLPRLLSKKILWIAGGIGITPFLSMSEWLLDKSQSRDISCLYFAKKQQHIFYDSLEKVASVKQLTSQYENITSLGHDFKEREIFLSGPQNFCMEYYQQFLESGIKRQQLHLDYFPGYSNF